MGDEALVEALASPGCPLCTHLDRQIRRYLEAALYEHTTDREFRGRLTGGGGFCPAHVRAVVEVDAAAGGDGVGAAIYLRSMVAARRRQLEAAAPSRRAASRVAQAARPAWACPACAREATTRDHAVLGLVQRVASDDAWRERVASAPWCLEHVCALVVGALRHSGDLGRQVLSGQRERLEGLESRLEGLAHDSSHGRRDRLTDEVRASARDAAAFLAGSRGR
jgi:hypothetical protein